MPLLSMPYTLSWRKWVQVAMWGGLPDTALRNGIIAHPTMAEGLNLLFANVPARRDGAT